MITMYLVSRGDYSDYCVMAIFDDKILAENYINAFTQGNDEMRIEEYYLNPYTEQLKLNYKAYMVIINKDGKVMPVKQKDSDYQISEPNKGISFTFDNEMRCCCFAKDEQHAVKIANEKRGEWLALNKWPD